MSSLMSLKEFLDSKAGLATPAISFVYVFFLPPMFGLGQAGPSLLQERGERGHPEGR